MEKILKVGFKDSLVKVGYLTGSSLAGTSYILHKMNFSYGEIAYPLFCSLGIIGCTFLHQYQAGKCKLENQNKANDLRTTV